MFSITLIGLHKTPQFLKEIDLILTPYKTIVARSVANHYLCCISFSAASKTQKPFPDYFIA